MKIEAQDYSIVRVLCAFVKQMTESNRKMMRVFQDTLIEHVRLSKEDSYKLEVKKWEEKSPIEFSNLY
jgi:hypothetical protein